MSIRKILFILISLTVSACSSTKHLPKGETLFVGGKVNIVDREASKKERKLLQHDIVALVRPRPNSTTLGVRFKLFLYNAAGDSKKSKGIRKWLRNKAGEPPVLASSVNANTNRDIMVNYLQNRGYFFAKGDAHPETKKKKTTLVFDIITGGQYKINKTVLVKDSSRICRDIDSTFSKTLLTKGAPYNLELIKAERARIDKELKERGYYFFRPEYLLVIVDSSVGGRKVDLFVKLKHKEIPPEAFKVFTMNDIYIYTNFRLNGKSTDTSKSDEVIVNGYHIIDKKKAFKPMVFSDIIMFDSGEVYNRTDQNTTVSRLVNMGTFKFVKNRFEPVGDSMLDVFFYLTPYPKKAIRMQIGALTQNDNMAGSQASVSWKNRNSFRGAEEFIAKVHGGFELQYSGVVKKPNIYNLGAETDISIPRFSVPFINISSSTNSLPRTIFKLKYNYEAQSNLLRINSYTASYGYNWKQGAHIEHQFYPVNFTYVRTDTLGHDSTKHLSYGNLIFNGIIIGPTYEFIYRSDVGLSRRHSFYFDGLIDFSGNILGLVQHADHENNVQTIAGAAYAQYMKFQPDFRYYFRASSSVTIATRVLAGIGLPYGNSAALPNIKQFWAGGNSDLRGFPSRLVGPGTFNQYAVTHESSYFETLGDMKLEFNLELRKNLYRFLNGALFMDAGNIWLRNDNSSFPGGKFTSNFYKELAVDVGVGLRLDFKILILRFDLGIPIREPWVTENNGYVFDKINFSDASWRRNNMVLNIGIGYPF